MTEIRESQCFRYSVHGGAEIDLVLDLPGQRIGFEFNSSAAPRGTESMRAGCKDLALTKLYVVFPGDIRSALDERIEALGIERLPEVCRGMQG